MTINAPIDSLRKSVQLVLELTRHATAIPVVDRASAEALEWAIARAEAAMEQLMALIDEVHALARQAQLTTAEHMDLIALTVDAIGAGEALAVASIKSFRITRRFTID